MANINFLTNIINITKIQIKERAEDWMHRCMAVVPTAVEAEAVKLPESVHLRIALEAVENSVSKDKHLN